MLQWESSITGPRGWRVETPHLYFTIDDSFTSNRCFFPTEPEGDHVFWDFLAVSTHFASIFVVGSDVVPSFLCIKV